MSATIDQAYVNTYETNVRHLAQQGASRLLPWCMQKSAQPIVTGKQLGFN